MVNLRPCSRRQNNLARRHNPEHWPFVGIHESPKGWRTVKPEGGLTKVYSTREIAAKERDELMWDAYFYRECEEEEFHCFNFIEWNYPDAAIGEATKEFDDWIYSQYEDAQHEGLDLIKEKGWT